MKHSFVSLAFLLLATGVAYGQRRELKPQLDTPLINDVMQGKIAMHPVTRYLEKSSAIVVDIDVTKIDVRKAADWLQQNFAPARKSPVPAEQIAAATGFIDSLKAAGAVHLYVTASTRSIFDGGPQAVLWQSLGTIFPHVRSLLT